MIAISIAILAFFALLAISVDLAQRVRALEKHVATLEEHVGKLMVLADHRAEPFSTRRRKRA